MILRQISLYGHLNLNLGNFYENSQDPYRTQRVKVLIASPYLHHSGLWDLITKIKVVMMSDLLARYLVYKARPSKWIYQIEHAVGTLNAW